MYKITYQVILFDVTMIKACVWKSMEENLSTELQILLVLWSKNIFWDLSILHEHGSASQQY